jgi:hypothetical protein
VTPRQSGQLLLLLGLSVGLLGACEGLNLSDIAGFLGPTVTVVIENDTAFTAIPDLRTSASRNIVEELFSEDDRITNFGFNGSVLANQTVTLRLRCDDELELILFNGADFQEGNGFPLGDIDGDTRLHRDSDFDCGDVLHIRLSGTVFNFYADIDVEHLGGGDSGRDGDDDDEDDDDDLASVLDDLFD